ncbi:hypothetical protein PR002_g13245 [Phytophthora rubi]|uniref:Uncharacterized protein n=1 Tax=Phytophthora rubi TaxID=129364 RepID=A0A6A3LEY0_9STRA|nr:hypothetical protein PR002_g13245 [Phytophthora rubi]
MKDKALRDAREEQQELEALHRLDEECVHQQRAGNYLKAFDCMERALVLRRHFFGIESEEVVQACRALAEMCNLLAMSFLQQDNYAVTIDLLKKAEVLTQRHHSAERATTLNNLACYYRRLGKLHSAMTSLKRALELEKILENVRNAADTQLNMCAVLSQLGKHQEALEHAQEALITLQEGFIQSKHTTSTSSGEHSEDDTSNSRLDRISVMCIAYHNVGVEQEFLKDYAESVSSYKKGIGLAEQYLGENHSITTTIRNSYLAAKRTLATKARVRPCSATRGQKSPAKAGSRLLLSPRSGSLRSPSPLAKDQSGHQIPTPRSIIADALSRAPLSALPPLEAQSPTSAGKKKKKKTDTRGAESEAPALSPTDPFFSPRFRFEDGSKAKKVAGITSPQSLVAANVEVHTPASSKGKRERRKSSVKKPPTTAEGGERSTKGSADERTNTSTASTRRPSEEGMTARVVESPGESDKTNDKEVIQGEPLVSDTASLSFREHSGAAEQIATLGNLDDHDDANNHQSRIMPRKILSVKTRGDSVDSEVDAVEGAISIVLTKIIDKIVEHDKANCSDEASTDFGEENTVVDVASELEANTDRGEENAVVNVAPELEANTDHGEEHTEVNEAPELEANTNRREENTVVNVAPELAESTDDLLSHSTSGFVNGDNSAESGDSFGVPEYVELEHKDDMEMPKNYVTPAENHVEDVVLPNDELQVVSELAENVSHIEEPHLLEADYPVEHSIMDGSQELSDPTQDNDSLAYESFGQDASYFDNTDTNEVDYAPPEAGLEAPTDGDVVFEDNEATAITDEQAQLFSAEVEEAGSIVDGVLYVYSEENSPVQALPELQDVQLASPEGELIAAIGDVDEQVFGQEADDSHFANDAEEPAPDLETQEQYIAEIHADPGNYDENYASAGHTIAEIEAHQDEFESVHQEEVGHDVSDFVDQSEQIAHNSELQDHETSEPQQDWSHAEEMETSTVDDDTGDSTEYYQEPSVPSHEELEGYDSNVETPEYDNGQTQGGDGSAVLTDAPDPDDGVDTSAQDPAAIE